jgi:energy-coupling factor transporter ATP-binding protein EcfA2
MSIMVNGINAFADKMRNRCICFAGNAGSGKSTLASGMAKIIHKETGILVDVKSFADVLRTVVIEEAEIDLPFYKRNYDLVDGNCRKIIFDKILSLCSKYKFEHNDVLIKENLDKCCYLNDIYRISLQFIGTDLFRNQVDNNYWVNKLIEGLAVDRMTIIDDGRFYNELEAANNRGISVYIIRDVGMMNEIFVNHESENSTIIQLCNFVYINKTHEDDYNVNNWIDVSCVKLLGFLIEYCNRCFD